MILPKVRYVPYGIANRFPDKIELHKKLLKPPYIPLHNELMEHEMRHSGYGYEWKDFKQDIKLKLKHKWLYRRFVLTTPSSWLNFFPIYISEGEVYVDKALAGTWIVSLILLWLFIMYYGK